MSLLARCSARTRVCCQNDIFRATFHSSASAAASHRKQKKRSFGLADDLSPVSPSGSIHVAPEPSSKARGKRPQFERDPLPHTDPEVVQMMPEVPKERNPSFRRASRARNERTGKWDASRFGGGTSQGSQMGLREDRPRSYGLNNSASSFRQRTPPGRGPPSLIVRMAPGSELEKRRIDFVQPGHSRLHQNQDAPHHGNLCLSDCSLMMGLDTQDPRDSELDVIMASQSLKNRNQPSPTPSPTQSQKSKPDTPPPPKKPKNDISLFDKPNVILARAGVPIVTKADPATASTTSEYSPAMSQKNDLPTKFTSPPLLPGLLKCLTDVLGGPLTPPTLIQALSLKWVLDPWTKGNENVPVDGTETAVNTEVRSDLDMPADNYKEFLLASETGSGKSIAYLLPMLQALKVSEARRLAEGATPIASKRGLNPRALILAPTHELARQLTTFAKALLHDVKLRVLCASRANNPTRPAKDELATAKGRSPSARRMKELVSFADDGEMGEFQVTADMGGRAFPVDVVVGTPMKLMEMVRGRGWEKEVEFGGGPAAAFEREQAKSGELSEDDAEAKEKGPKRRRGRDSVPGVGKWSSSPEMGLSEIEWVVVDEADVLFDSDFQETTRMLLADIAKARGREVPFTSLPVGLLPATPTPEPPPATSRQKEKEKKAEEKAKAQGQSIVKYGKSAITPLNYPFNFLVTSATIPNWLSSYLNAYHPALLRLVSPNLHRLPKSLKTEYVSWTGGNKNADIERRLRKVWAADAADGLGPVPGSLGDMSKVLIFCNKNNKVDDLGSFLEEKGIKNVQLSGASPNRKRGSNTHLDGFLKRPARETKEKPVDDWSASWVADKEIDVEEAVPAATTPAVVKGKGKDKDTLRSLVPLMKQGPPPPVKNDPMNVPHVMITTSLLSRGLDFSPNIKYVFIIDEPRKHDRFSASGGAHWAGRREREGCYIRQNEREGGVREVRRSNRGSGLWLHKFIFFELTTKLTTTHSTSLHLSNPLYLYFSFFA
ncbi:hypothetical protein MVEN_00221600 [Mycena venus]|uniref:RNA helicase n=1 Tax=Mycena venus TaxID=2733690 RepID=A0A8H7DE97_9AGAR|nr:hypothetical protein MVEN_00221600 [Mycena venus]